MAKAKAHFPSLYNEMKEILDEFSDSLFEDREIAVEKAADYLEQKYIEATPEGKTGQTKQAWTVNKKYKGVKYIFNTQLSKDGIPVVNLVEFSKNGKPFMRPTFEREKGNVIRIITEELKR